MHTDGMSDGPGFASLTGIRTLLRKSHQSWATTSRYESDAVMRTKSGFNDRYVRPPYSQDWQ